MFLNELMTGSSLPDRTLCLTFDDGPGRTSDNGPGPRTLDVARYLHDQGIRGTFFMTGKYASNLPEIMKEVRSLGHLIANHTYEHPQMVNYLAAGGYVVDQVVQTDAIIRKWVDAPVVFFRPPYLAWSSHIAHVLNSNLTVLLHHVGLIGCDIDAGDVHYWAKAGSPADCANAYFEKIQEVEKGIVLMHDSTSDKDAVRKRNEAVELVKILIPMLKKQGYRFARVDEIPDVAAEVNRPLTFALKASNDLYISPQSGGGNQIMVNSPAAIGAWEWLKLRCRSRKKIPPPLLVKSLGIDKVSLQAANGLFFSPQNGGGEEVLANAPTVGEWEPLDLISLGANRVAFRITGHNSIWRDIF